MLLPFVQLWGKMGAEMEDKIKDLTNFNEIAFLRGDAAYKRYVDSIFQVSVSANRQLYGKASGKIEGVIQLYHEEMGLAPQEIVVRIMSRFSLDEETAQKYVENTLGLQPV